MPKHGVTAKTNLMSVQEGTVQANGHALEYHRHSGQSEDSPTIVMLHEGLGSVSTWRDFPALLAARTGAAAFCPRCKVGGECHDMASMSQDFRRGRTKDSTSSIAVKERYADPALQFREPLR